jgi:hypothetical protein
MRDWVLVMAMHGKSPTADELRKVLKYKEFKHRAHAASRLVLLSRDQLHHLFGPTFVERARLFFEVQPPVDAAPLKPTSKPKSKRTRKSASASTSEATRCDVKLGDGKQRAL